MTSIKKERERSRLTQFFVASRSGVPRMRLSLAECGQLRLRPEEEAAVRGAIREGIEQQAAHLLKLLTVRDTQAVATART
jgi:hypothetical protein